jgi:hypothetical protein
MSNKFNNSLIDDLVDDLKPTRPLNIWVLSGVALLATIVLSVLIMSFFGIRSDIIYALKSGVIAWKNGGLLVIAIGSFIYVMNNSRPVKVKSNSVILFMLLLVVIVIYQIMKLVISGTFEHELTNINFGAYQTCMSIILVGGGVVYLALWKFWLKNGASTNPQIQGTMAGILSGAIAAFSYAFHCNMDSIFYYMICYLSPIVILGIIGYNLGAHLKW